MKKLGARLEGRTPDEGLRQGPVPKAYVDRPIYYISNRFNVSGPDAEISWPKYSAVMDFELEFAAVIGKRGRDVPAASARAYIFGYTLFNDFSARDRQYLEMQGGLGPTKGKSFDGANAFGPWITTADEVPDPYAIPLEVRVNGEIWSSGSSAGMLHTFEEMIAYVSESETIMAGEIFGSGTINGGCGLEFDRYIDDGDVVELVSPVLGTLRTTVRRG